MKPANPREAIITDIDGVAQIVESKGVRKVIVRGEDEEKSYNIPYGAASHPRRSSPIRGRSDH